MANTNEMITIILSSTVLVGIISTIASLIINKKNNSLKYITDDRRSWREEIRTIVSKLEKSKPYNSKEILAELKVRINPYGKSDSSILHDSHIWDIIQLMEDENNEIKYKEHKEQLIYYLSLLLKYDWERAKKEVSGNRKEMGLLMTSIVGLIYLLYKHFIEYKLEYNGLLLVAIFTFICIPIIIGMGVLKDAHVAVWERDGKICLKVLRRIGVSASAIFYSLSMFLLLPGTVLKAYNFSLIRILTAKGYFDTTFVIVVVMLLYTLAKNLTLKNITRNYIDAVEKYIKDNQSEQNDTNHQ